MAVTAKMYGLCFLAAFNKEIDILTDTIKVMLVTSTYTPDQDTHDYLDDVVADEITGTGYTAGGATLANDTFTYTTGTNVIKYDADDATWASSTITARTAIVYDASPASDATRPLICYQQESGDIISTNGTFSVVWNASGIFTITVG